MTGRILTMYFDWASPPSRALMTLIKLSKISNVKYQEVRLSKNEHHTSEFHKISPLQTLPTITETSEDSSPLFTLCESHAIMRYLSWSRPEEVPDHFYPRSDHKRRALVD